MTQAQLWHRGSSPPRILSDCISRSGMLQLLRASRIPAQHKSGSLHRNLCRLGKVGRQVITSVLQCWIFLNFFSLLPSLPLLHSQLFALPQPFPGLEKLLGEIRLVVAITQLCVLWLSCCKPGVPTFLCPRHHSRLSQCGGLGS